MSLDIWDPNFEISKLEVFLYKSLPGGLCVGFNFSVRLLNENNSELETKRQPTHSFANSKPVKTTLITVFPKKN